MIRIALCLICFLPLSSFAEEALINNSIIEKWGYRILDKPIYNSFYCDSGLEDSNYIERQYIGIKSIKPMKGYKDTFYRFTIIVEKFKSNKLAELRLDQLANPDYINSKDSKTCGIKESFRVDNMVYSIHTDAFLFIEERARIRKLLEGQTKKD